MRVTLLDHIEAVTDHIYTLWLKPERKPSYLAGQYVELYLPHKNADDRGEKRWFTLSSSPTEELLSITTKHYGDPVSSFKQALFALKPGAELNISEPMGDFVLPKDVTIPLVFVVGGIGVTPVRSIIKWLFDTNEKRDIRIIYAARRIEEVAFRDLFDSYGTSPEIVLSQADLTWVGRTGTITAELIMELAGKDERQLIYVSGPEPMTETLEKDLKNLGVASERLVLDFFPGYTSE